MGDLPTGLQGCVRQLTIEYTLGQVWRISFCNRSVITHTIRIETQTNNGSRILVYDERSGASLGQLFFMNGNKTNLNIGLQAIQSIYNFQSGGTVSLYNPSTTLSISDLHYYQFFVTKVS